MNEAQKAAFQRLEQNGYLPQLREFAMARCAPFFWSFQHGTGQPKIRNGTVTYVRTGQRDIGITASHVYDSRLQVPSYLRDLADHPDTEAQFGGRVAYPELQHIDHNPSLDLATFNVPEEFVLKAHKAIHTTASWPPRPIRPGELVLYGGYPGVLKEPSGGQIVWPFQSFIWRVTDVTDANILMHVDFPNLFWPGHEEERINDNPRGISGGPVFRIIEDLPNRRVGLELVGIIYEYFEPWEVVQARHIRHVLADGSLMPLS